jgi:hypothetical protein
MSIITTETAIVQALKAALAPVSVFWGWAPFESTEEPPTLPLATVARALFSTANWLDMCDDGSIGDTTLLVHVWSIGYEQGRAIQTIARECMLAQAGWVLQSETDIFEPAFRAWRIESQWMAAGAAPQ